MSCMHAKSLQSCLTLCNPMHYSLPGSSVQGIRQARILQWVQCPSPGDLPDPGIKPASLTSPSLAGGFFTTSATWEAIFPIFCREKTEVCCMSMIESCGQGHPYPNLSRLFTLAIGPTEGFPQIWRKHLGCLLKM